MKETYILGAGTSGLITHFYNPNTKIISKDIGGQAKYALAPLNIFVNKWTTKLLSDLGLKAKIVKKQFGFFINGKYYLKVPKSIRNSCINKKLQDCKCDKHSKLSNISWDPKATTFEVYDVSFGKLVDALMKHVKKEDLINDEVALIDMKTKTIVTKNFDRYKFDKIISTIPMPQFRYLAFNLPLHRDFLYMPVTFAVCDKLPAIMRQKHDFELIYCPEERYKYHRISRDINGWSYEFAGDLSKEEIAAFLDTDVNIVKYTLQRVGVMFGKEMTDIKDITFLSRLAQWNSEIRIEHVVQKAIEINTNGVD